MFCGLIRASFRCYHLCEVGGRKPSPGQAGRPSPSPAQRPQGLCGALRPQPPLQGTHPLPLQKEWAETATGRNSPLPFHSAPLGRARRGAEKARDGSRPRAGAWQTKHSPPKAIARQNLQAHHGAWKPRWGHNTGRILLGRDKRIPRFSLPSLSLGTKELAGSLEEREKDARGQHCQKLHTALCTLHLSPLTLFFSSLTSHPAPLTSHPSPCSSHLSPCISHPLLIPEVSPQTD